jgi:hypothetical protein
VLPVVKLLYCVALTEDEDKMDCSEEEAAGASETNARTAAVEAGHPKLRFFYTFWVLLALSFSLYLSLSLSSLSMSAANFSFFLFFFFLLYVMCPKEYSKGNPVCFLVTSRQ